MIDGYTQKIAKKMEEWIVKVKMFENNGRKLVQNVPEFAEYLSDYRLFTPVGLALRRFMCEKYGKPCEDSRGAYVYVMSDGTQVITTDHVSPSYDIEKDDVNEYVEIFFDVVLRYNADTLHLLDTKAMRQEVRRLLKSSTDCNRDKAFLLSFALHLNEDDVTKFLNETLAESTYSLRDPQEVIALFCQSHEAFNSYGKYLELCEKYEEIKKNAGDVQGMTKANYTLSVKKMFDEDIHSEEELIEFLKANIPNFTGRCETAFKEWLLLYQSISEELTDNAFAGFVYDERAAEWSKKAEQAVKAETLVNPERLSREILDIVIPRDSRVTERHGKKITICDFVSISTGTGSKKRTTLMPKQVMENMPFSDRLWDIIRLKKSVERKDIIFLKFFLLALRVEKTEYEPSTDSVDFIVECNNILATCGMTGLYPGNRFENLVLLTLLTKEPYIRFSDLIFESFII